MEKLKMQTTNVVDENIKKIGELFLQSREKVFLYHCLQQFWSKVGNTSLLNQRKLLLVLAYDEFAFFAINLSKQMVVTFVCLFHADVGNRMTVH